jgi:hypothetical protein
MWHLKCGACHSYALGSGQKVLLAMLALVIGASVVVTIDYFAVDDVPDGTQHRVTGEPANQVYWEAPQGNPNPSGPNTLGQRSNPDHPRPAYKRHL